LEELREDVRRLTAAVERLEQIQRKESGQLTKLRDVVAEGAAAARRSQAASEASAEDLRGMAKHVGDADARAALLDRFDSGRQTDAKWRKIFSNQLTALLRHVCLPLDRLPAPQALNARRFRLRSQNEEDGVLLALLESAGWGACRFVEIGSGKSGGNSAGLAHECGWSGLLVELSERSVDLARAKFAGNRGVTAVAARVTPANVNELLAQYGYGSDVDVLSIDIDSYDYWILEALTVTPRILILEYNALFGAERRVTIPADQPLDGTPKGYNGASLAALTTLAGRKGYRLVTCENAGVNAFYLRHDVAPEVREVTPVEAFKPLRSRVDLADAEIKTDIYAAAAKRNLPLLDV
jgi:hypothetical protein